MRTAPVLSLPPVEAPTITRELERPDLLPELLTDVEEKGQVTVHCSFVAGLSDAIRIWPSTFLVCRHSGHRSQLLFAEGIPMAPTWMPVPAGNAIHFTLLFAGLPSHCVLFDLVEEIADLGGFHVPAILRNDMDVYRVEI
jgi:hypothetical protein